MNTRPELQPSSSPSGGLRGVTHDQRGAIMVLGIFMCTCLVGILWYLAGIGDAIIYRERMQEASDAVAFSAAVIHARGMNLIVLINLIMALILSIRVALKVAQAVCLLLALIFAFIPFMGWLSAICGEAAELLQNVIDATKQPIDQTLKALNVVEGGIAYITPPGAIAGSLMIGNKYVPTVKQNEAAAVAPGTIAAGLPVEDGSPDILCKKAGESVVQLIALVGHIPPAAANKASGLFGKIISAGGAYFCDIGGGGSPPDFSSIVEDESKDQCGKNRDKLVENQQDAQRAYDEKCTALSAPCGGGSTTPTASEQAELDTLKARADAAQAEVDKFSMEQCEKDNKAKADAVKAKLNTKQNTNSGGGGIFPKKVKKDWKNGVNDAQVLSAAVGSDTVLKIAPQYVKIGEWKHKDDITLPTTYRFSMSQAEFFYDCRGKWDSGGNCNDRDGNNEAAMWHFRWRARLRRFNEPFGNSAVVQKITEAVQGADVYRQVASVDPQNAFTFQNALTLAELGQILVSGDIVIH